MEFNYYIKNYGYPNNRKELKKEIQEIKEEISDIEIAELFDGICIKSKKNIFNLIENKGFSVSGKPYQTIKINTLPIGRLPIYNLNKNNDNLIKKYRIGYLKKYEKRLNQIKFIRHYTMINSDIIKDTSTVYFSLLIRVKILDTAHLSNLYEYINRVLNLID